MTTNQENAMTETAACSSEDWPGATWEKEARPPASPLPEGRADGRADATIAGLHAAADRLKFPLRDSTDIHDWLLDAVAVPEAAGALDVRPSWDEWEATHEALIAAQAERCPDPKRHDQQIGSGSKRWYVVPEDVYDRLTEGGASPFGPERTPAPVEDLNQKEN